MKYWEPMVRARLLNADEINRKISKSWTKERKAELSKSTKLKWSKGIFHSKFGSNHPRWVPRVSIYCQNCFHKFKATPYKAKSRKFCSKRCYSSWQQKWMKGKRNFFFGRHHTTHSNNLNRTKHLRKNISIETLRKITIARSKQRFPTDNTKINIIIRNGLNSRRIKNTSKKWLLGRFLPDAFIEPNICVYCDGDYWHGNPKIYKKFDHIQLQNRKRDRRANLALRKAGYKIIRFWESKIEEDSRKCLDKIEQIAS